MLIIRWPLRPSSDNSLNDVRVNQRLNANDGPLLSNLAVQDGSTFRCDATDLAYNTCAPLLVLGKPVWLFTHQLILPSLVRRNESWRAAS